MSFVYTPVSGAECSRCLQAATIQEALFNRIHLLEKQLYQAFTDKDAAIRALLFQTTTRASSVNTSGSSTVYADPICSSPESSPLSFGASGVPAHPFASQPTEMQQLPLIDLLGPIEEAPAPCVESYRSFLIPGIRQTDVQDSVDEAHSISPTSRTDLQHGDAGSVAYIRHFSEKPQPILFANETASHATLPQPENEIPAVRDTSLDPSFTESQQPSDPTHKPLSKTKDWVPHTKTDTLQWVGSTALEALSVALSSKKRWENYCQNIAAKTSGDLGVRCIEQETCHTVMIYNLPADCTMKNVLDQVRGGMILDANLLDTTTITGSMTCMLTFVKSTAAVAFTDHVRRHGLLVSGCVVKAFLVQVPTARIKLGQIRAINSLYHSRCLRIHDLPLGTTLEELRCDLRPNKATSIDVIENMSINADDVLELRFFSVTAAEDAFEFLTQKGVKPKYWQCRVVFGADPCAEPLVEDDGAAKDTDSTPVSHTNIHQSTSADLGTKAKAAARNRNAVGVENIVVSEKIECTELVGI